jgi:hypothetical protein
MTSVCYTPWKIPAVRVTKLDACGVPVTGCSTVVSNGGIISVEMTKEYEDRQEFFVKNGDGNFCVRATNPPILKWLGLTLTFCSVDPELVNILSAEPLVLDNAVAPKATGYSTEEGSAAASNFALEGWTRVTNLNVPCTGGPEYGYTLWPWCIEGTISDMTFQNDVVNFVLTCRTQSNSPWGTGPYMVDYSDNPAGSTTQIPLLTPIGSRQHSRMFLTRLAPPADTCGCVTLADLIP